MVNVRDDGNISKIFYHNLITYFPKLTGIKRKAGLKVDANYTGSVRVQNLITEDFANIYNYFLQKIAFICFAEKSTA